MGIAHRIFKINKKAIPVLKTLRQVGFRTGITFEIILKTNQYIARKVKTKNEGFSLNTL